MLKSYIKEMKAGKKMNIKKLLIVSVITFAIAFAVTLGAYVLVTYLYSFIAHGAGTIDWETAFRFAIMLGISLGVVLPIIRAIMDKKK